MNRRGAFAVPLLILLVVTLIASLFVSPFFSLTGFIIYSEITFNGSSSSNLTFNGTYSNITYITLPLNATARNATVNVTGVNITGWLPDVNLTNQTIGLASGQKLGVDSQNNIHVVWSDNRSGNNEIYYKKVNGSSGVNLTGDIQLTNQINNSVSPDVVVDSQDSLHVVWTDTRLNSLGSIFYTKLDNNGTTLIDDLMIANETNQRDFPRINVGSDNSPSIVWYDSRLGSNSANWDIFYKKLNSTGSNLTGDVRVSFNTTSQSDWPVVVVDSNNNANIVWYDTRFTTYGIFYEKLNSTGGNITSETQIVNLSPNNRFDPDIAIDSNNNIHVVWYEQQDGNNEIYYKKLNSTGSNLTGDTRLTNNANSSQEPTIAVDSQGNVHITWQDRVNGEAATEIYYEELNNSGINLTGNIRVTNNSGRSVSPAIIVDHTDKPHIVWSDNRTNSFEIYYTNYYNDYPLNPRLDVGNNGMIEFSYTGRLNNTLNFNGTSFVNGLNDVLVNSCVCTACLIQGTNCSISINTSVESRGQILYSALNITYELDRSAMNISNIVATVTTGTATINWTTDDLGNSTINLGTTTALGNFVSNSSLIFNHSILLTGLSSNTLYYYNITSCDAANNCITNGTLTFRTDSVASTPSSNGGGGTTSVSDPPCVPYYFCDIWSQCKDGKQSRMCDDLNNCAEPKAETQSCTVIQEEKPKTAGIIEETKAPVKESPSVQPIRKSLITALLFQYQYLLWIVIGLFLVLLLVHPVDTFPLVLWKDRRYLERGDIESADALYDRAIRRFSTSKRLERKYVTKVEQLSLTLDESEKEAEKQKAEFVRQYGRMKNMDTADYLSVFNAYKSLLETYLKLSPQTRRDFESLLIEMKRFASQKNRDEVHTS